MARTRIVRITNRTTEPLDVMYDGAPDVIPPGFKLDGDGDDARVIGAGPVIEGKPTVYTHPCEYFAAEAYKRQHPRMGTQDPMSVDARDTEYLLGVEEWGDDVSPIEQTDADELIDRSKLPVHRQKAVTLGPTGARDVKGNKAAKARRKAQSKRKAIAQANRRSAYVDSKLNNPTGMMIKGLADG